MKFSFKCDSDCMKNASKMYIKTSDMNAKHIMQTNIYFSIYNNNFQGQYCSWADYILLLYIVIYTVHRTYLYCMSLFSH